MRAGTFGHRMMLSSRFGERWFCFEHSSAFAVRIPRKSVETNRLSSSSVSIFVEFARGSRTTLNAWVHGLADPFCDGFILYSSLFFAKIAKISVCFKIPANVQQQYSNNIIVF